MDGNLSLAFFGIDCLFTRTVLANLLDASAPVALVCLPGPRDMKEPLIQRPPSRANLGILQPAAESVASLAHRHRIDIWRLGDLHAPTMATRLRALSVDSGVVACYTRRIPMHVAEAFRLGMINIHPSLLPDKRGPDPQFWMLKEGLGMSGVTVHRLAERFDAGPILAQQPVALNDGVTEAELDQATAAAGARLLLDLLPKLAGGEALETPQDDDMATYAPFPDASDFRLDRDRPARVAFNFARGVAARGVPIRVEVDSADWIIEEAIAYWPAEPPTDLQPEPDEIVIGFTPGTLLARAHRAKR